MKRAGMEQKKVANREGFLFRNLAAVLAAAAMMLLIPAAAQAGADDYYWDEQTVKEWQENSAQSSEKEEQGFEGYTEEVWSYCEKEPTESENPAGENETGGSHAVAPGFISEESLIETAPVVRSTGNLNTFNTEGVEVHPVPGEYPGLDDAPFDDKHDPSGFDLFNPSSWGSGQSFDLFNPSSWGSGQSFDPFNPSSWGSGNNAGDNPDETGDTFWFGADETIMSGDNTDSRNPDPDNCIPLHLEADGKYDAYHCKHRDGDSYYSVSHDEEGNIHFNFSSGNSENSDVDVTTGGFVDDPADDEINIEEGEPFFTPNLPEDDDSGNNDDAAESTGSSDDDEKDEKGCEIDPTMDGGGNNGQGVLANAPPADYDPRTDGFHNGGAQPDMPQDYDGSSGNSGEATCPHTRGAQPRMLPDYDGSGGNSGEATCPHTRGAQPDMPQDYYGGGTILDNPFTQGKEPVFPGGLFNNGLELNTEKVEK